MSGTSMDGIDVALLDFSSRQPRLLARHGHPYPDELRQDLVRALALPDPQSADLGPLDDAMGEVFAEATNALLAQAGVPAATVTAIGSHGQTIHLAPDAPRPYSLQIGNPARIASRTGIEVIADFRRADIDAGGQGAPLVPAFHKSVFAERGEHRVVVNIGGIANVAILPSDPARAVIGFDTGPGNTLMDQWAQHHLGTAMDLDGNWARQGEVDEPLLQALLSDPWFGRLPPKSTGREHFNLSWLAASLQVHGTGGPANVQATLCELTARSIAEAVKQHAAGTRRLLICGGGVHNSRLLERLYAALPALAVESTAALGLDPDWVEAAAFAWLARQHLQGKAGNIPEVTGAARAVVLGARFRPAQG
jgi:anhydro-N-acetylmuramic acid kinase